MHRVRREVRNRGSQQRPRLPKTQDDSSVAVTVAVKVRYGDNDMRTLIPRNTCRRRPLWNEVRTQDLGGHYLASGKPGQG